MANIANDSDESKPKAFDKQGSGFQGFNKLVRKQIAKMDKEDAEKPSPTSQTLPQKR